MKIRKFYAPLSEEFEWYPIKMVLDDYINRCNVNGVDCSELKSAVNKLIFYSHIELVDVQIPFLDEKKAPAPELTPKLVP